MADFSSKVEVSFIDGFSKGAAAAKAQLSELTAAGAGFDRVGRGMIKTGAGLTALLVEFGAAAIKVGNELDRGLANVQSLGLTQERVKELRRGVQEAAIATETSTGTMVDGLYQVVFAFRDSADTLKILELNAKAAKAGVATVEESISLISAITKGYGNASLEAMEAAADLSLMIVKLGQTDFPQLAASMGRVIPLAANLGVSEEELRAALATLTRVTGSAAEVSTQMRGTLQALSAPTSAMTALIQEQGFASGKAMIDQLGLQGSFLAIARAAKETGKPLEAYMGSIEGQTAALTLTGAQVDTLIAKMEEMKQISGITDAAFLAQTKGINAQGSAIDLLRVKMEVMMQRLSEGLGPALTTTLEIVGPFAEKIGALATRFAELEPAQQKNIVKLLDVVEATGQALTVLGELSKGVGIAVKLFRSIRVALFGVTTAAGVATPGLFGLAAAHWAVLGPVLAIIAGLAALAVGVVLVVKHWDKIKEFFVNLWKDIKGIFASSIEWIKGIFASGIEWIKGVLAKIPIVGDFLNKNENAGVAVVDTMAAGVDSALPAAEYAGFQVAASFDRYLPHSNAKVGPLSNLTESGASLVETFAQGANKKRIDRVRGGTGWESGGLAGGEGNTTVIIENLTVQSEDAEDIFRFVRMLRVAGGAA